MSNKTFVIYPSRTPGAEWTTPLDMDPARTMMVSSAGGVFRVVQVAEVPEYGLLWAWKKVATFDPAHPPGPLPETMMAVRGDDERRFYKLPEGIE